MRVAIRTTWQDGAKTLIDKKKAKQRRYSILPDLGWKIQNPRESGKSLSQKFNLLLVRWRKKNSRDRREHKPGRFVEVLVANTIKIKNKKLGK